MAEPQALAQVHPVEVWGALVGSMTIVGALITLLYKRQNDDIKAHQTQLENGAKAFIEVGKELVRIGEKITALQAAGNFDDQELDRLGLDIKQLQDRVLIIETEHKPCQEYLKELKKEGRP